MSKRSEGIWGPKDLRRAFVEGEANRRYASQPTNSACELSVIKNDDDQDSNSQFTVISPECNRYAAATTDCELLHRV